MRISLIPTSCAEKKAILLLIPSEIRILCRGEQLLLRFFGEGSRQLKPISASLVVQGAE